MSKRPSRGAPSKQGRGADADYQYTEAQERYVPVRERALKECTTGKSHKIDKVYDQQQEYLRQKHGCNDPEPGEFDPEKLEAEYRSRRGRHTSELDARQEHKGRGKGKGKERKLEEEEVYDGESTSSEGELESNLVRRDPAVLRASAAATLAARTAMITDTVIDTDTDKDKDKEDTVTDTDHDVTDVVYASAGTATSTLVSEFEGLCVTGTGTDITTSTDVNAAAYPYYHPSIHGSLHPSTGSHTHFYQAPPEINSPSQSHSRGQSGSASGSGPRPKQRPDPAELPRIREGSGPPLSNSAFAAGGVSFSDGKVCDEANCTCVDPRCSGRGQRPYFPFNQERAARKELAREGMKKKKKKKAMAEGGERA